jgi:hypothetical protein
MIVNHKQLTRLSHGGCQKTDTTYAFWNDVRLLWGFLGRILEILKDEQESSPLSWERRTYFYTTYAFLPDWAPDPDFWRVFGEFLASWAAVPVSLL